MISNQFSPPTTHWFTSAFESATPIQQAAWATISQGKHTLIVAPTGSGKTLAAFLWALDNLVSSPTPVDKPACRILYVSPLKALAVDVERNLRAPLIGLTNACHQLNLPLPSISIATRTADTSQAERRAFARKPTDILITTPESLFLLLTSSASSALTAITTVIIDEVHALCSNKRGSHLALSLERLDLLCAKPAQRIGLSATVEPLTEAAEFLGGVAPVTIVNPPSRKKFDITVSACSADRNPVVDIPTGNASANPGAGSLWEPVIHELHQVIGRHHSTIVFTNSRRLCERLSGGLNELSNLQTHNPPPAQAPAQFMGASGQGGSSPAVIARTHHGSMSKQQRALVEESLKAGEIPAVVATSSLELGIDMGAVDLVAHISAPPSVAAGLQRLGRAGHHVNAVSRGIIFPIHQADIISCTVIAERMHAGQLESLRYRRNPLDVLAQHIVSMVAMDQWQVDELATVIRRAAPFTALPDSSLYAVLDMLSGRYVSDDFAQLRPQIIWNRITNMLSARPGAARLAITSGGTIPDRGLFGVFIVGADKNRATRVGELDEEMVYESRVGDVIVLGSSSWKIQEITHDRVLVSPAPGQPGRMPYWHGDFLGRPFELGQAIGAFTRQITQDPVRVKQPTAAITLTPHTQDSILDYIRQQQQATIAVPDDQTIVVERFRDELGDWRIVVHSIFGGCINAPWGLAIAARLRDQYGIDGQIMSADDGIVIRFPDLSGESAPPDSDLVVFDPLEISGIVTQQISGSALFASRFRECAARSLLLPKRNPAQRAALWQQRQRAASLLQIASKHHNFPVVLEALRECLHDVYDLENLQKIMQNIADRTITIADVTTISPSPFSRSLLFSYVGTFLYDGDSPLAERKAQALALDSVVLTELLGRTELHDLLDPQVIDEITQQLQWLSPQRQARNLEQVADLLQIVGPLTTDEAIRRGAQEDWLNELEKTRRIIRIRHGGQWYWIITEDAGRVRDALGVVLPPGLAASVCESVPDP